MESMKDWIQILVWIVGIFVALYQLRQSINQRKEELKWKKVQAAKELLDDIHCNNAEKNALHMLDWWDDETTYVLPSGVTELISYVYVITALRKNGVEARDTGDQYIRDCFDWLFFRIDRIEHYIRRGFIDFLDVKTVFEAYVPFIKEHDAFYEFLDFHEYKLAKGFFNRY